MISAPPYRSRRMTTGAFSLLVERSADPATNRLRINAALQRVKVHGGTVELGAGDWPLATVQGTTPGASAGAWCLRIPSNVRLRGQGPGGTRLIATAGGAFGTGAVITPEGMDTATADYGAASNWAVSDLSMEAADQAASSGNLISLYHASDFVLENLALGPSYYHALEIGTSRRGKIRGIKISGERTSTSGVPIQFDNGDGGHRSTAPTGSTILDIDLDGIVILQRPPTGGVYDIEGFHSSTQILQRVAFRNCYFEGVNRDNSFIFDANSTGVTNGGIRGLQFDNCTFVAGHHGNTPLRVPPTGAGGWHDDLAVRGCTFRGPAAAMLWVYGNTNALTNIANDDRRNYQVIDNRFEFDGTGMPASAKDYNLMLLNQLSGAIVRGNVITKTGDFPAGHTVLNACSAIRVGNCRDLTLEDNLIRWYGNNVASSRTGIYWSNEASDTAGTTRRTICRRNTLWSENANVWTYGILKQLHTVAVANRIDAFTENWASGAASSNLLQTGTP